MAKQRYTTMTSTPMTVIGDSRFVPPQHTTYYIALTTDRTKLAAT